MVVDYSHLTVLSDDALVERFRTNRDQACFSELVARYRKRLTERSRSVLGNLADAEDVVQEIFLRMFQKIDQYHPGNFAAWLSSIARTVCLNRLAAALPPPLALNQAVRSMTFSDSVEIRLSLEEALSSLPPMQRICLKLFYTEGCSYKQVAAQTSIPVKSVRAHIQNGRRRLRSALEG